MNETGEDLSWEARRLIRQARVATLATTGRADSPAADFPYASLVLVAADQDAAPLLLISALAEHTRNLAADPRVSLLFDGTSGFADPLEGARLTLLGHAAPAIAAHQRARFLKRHPTAEAYAGFKDFSLIRIEPQRGHLVAGFGRITWLDAREFMFDTRASAALVEAEAEIVKHMNEDHADAIELYARVLLGRRETGWRLCGIDPEGIDLRAGSATARLDFETRVRDADEARTALVALVRQARANTADESGRRS